MLDHVARVAAPHQRVEEPAVHFAVREACGLLVGLAGRRRHLRTHVQHDPHLRARAIAADDRHGPPVRQQQVMSRRVASSRL